MIDNLKSALRDSQINPNYRRRQATLKSLDQLAWLLDNSIGIPFTRYRFGLESLLGLIPVFGDIAGLLLSAYIVVQAMRLGTPRSTLAHMVKNVAFELALGAIPIVGDVFDATYKANLRNVRLARQAIER